MPVGVGKGPQRQDALNLTALDVWILEKARRAQSIVLMVVSSRYSPESLTLARLELI
jgi:hypothetical protein